MQLPPADGPPARSSLAIGATAALDAIYAAVDHDVAARGPRCELSGRCCRFDEFGHRLFLTRLEADRLLAQGLPVGTAVEPGLCPFQQHLLCTARDRRPLGCRVYFCDPAYEGQAELLSEKYLAAIRRLHDEAGIPCDDADLHWHLARWQHENAGGAAQAVDASSPTPG